MHLDVSLTRSFCFSLLLDVTDEMLSFFLTLFQGLRVQMGVPFTEQIIQTFLNMFTRYCPTLVTSFSSLRMVYLRSCSALSLKWAVSSLCGQTLSHPRAGSEENTSQSGEPQDMLISHTCHCAVPALPRAFWKCGVLN